MTDGHDETTNTYAVIAAAVIMLIGALTMAWWAPRHGDRPNMRFACGFTAIGLGWVAAAISLTVPQRPIARIAAAVLLIAPLALGPILIGISRHP